MNDRRFIEESFPVKEVGEASAREKNIRHGHISTLHIWWARRPLAASRATAYAALTPAPKDAEEWQKKRDFIIQLSQWENSNNQSLLERARREILEANGGVPPKVLDPFSGGGSYPLEALRLGCESYANDYNPVAVLIEKATLEYPQKFGRPFEGMPEWAKPQITAMKDKGGKKKGKKNVGEQPALFDPTAVSEPTDFNPLLNAVRYWSEWILQRVRKELEQFYPSDPDGSTPVGYIWARTISCQNPACGQDIPLMRQFWIANKDKKKIALYPKVNHGKLNFHIVGDGYEAWPEGYNPDNGTVARAVAKCLVCGSIVDDDTTRRLFREGKSGEQIVLAILAKDTGRGKLYRIANDSDANAYHKVNSILSKKNEQLLLEWGLEPIPDEPLPIGGRGKYDTCRLPLYGMKKWGEIFNNRQQLVMITLVDAVRHAYSIMLSDDAPEEFVKAVVTYLGFGIDEVARFSSTLNPWKVDAEAIVHAFGRQALPMLWDYNENNPLGTHGGTWANRTSEMLDVIESLGRVYDTGGKVTNNSATSIRHPDSFFDAILTDPPYYDNVPYSDLSDFFYVWLKRSLGHVFSDLFATPLTPKGDEAVADAVRHGNKDLAKKFFEDHLRLSFKEIRRLLKQDGITTIVYAHKSTEGWETVINALLDSALVITAAWPLNTEMQSRLRARENASLASSIYIVARKTPRNPTGFYNDVRQELNKHLDAKLHRLWEEGIGGGDFFIAAIGSAIEVFGKYEQVMDYEGNIVRADRLLEDVRSIATNYAVKQILHNGFAAEITPMARFYVLWRWNYGEALVPFDEANKLAHSCGLDLSLQFSKNGFIKKEKEFVRMLGPQGRKLDDLDDPRDMIDVLHKSLLLWEKGQRGEMVKALSDRGFGRSEAFYRVAQAISETLPLESKEKKLLDGFLAGRDRVQEDVEKETGQGKLF
jgi:adenine-specific DNA methylase